jgi:putative transposase
LHGGYPNDDAVVKLPWPTIRAIKDKRARTGPAEGKRTGRKAEPRLVEGQVTTSWKAALGALVIA